ncbi:Putative F-box protein [Frankliniella fusca]|uniref:F-box protein n=1 Tax=Frankliniella fusca TaxID=407009 RepID=A0AAE1GXL5_9NEOP|nr:Putative F-box protein [Frankliniella fusca]
MDEAEGLGRAGAGTDAAGADGTTSAPDSPPTPLPLQRWPHLHQRCSNHQQWDISCWDSYHSLQHGRQRRQRQLQRQQWSLLVLMQLPCLCHSQQPLLWDPCRGRYHSLLPGLFSINNNSRFSGVDPAQYPTGLHHRRLLLPHQLCHCISLAQATTLRIISSGSLLPLPKLCTRGQSTPLYRQELRGKALAAAARKFYRRELCLNLR